MVYGIPPPRPRPPPPKHHTPLNPQFFTFPLPTKTKPGTVLIRGVLPPPAIFSVQYHFFGDIANGQIANELAVVCINKYQSFAFERNRWILLHVEEICGTKMIIPLCVARVDTRCFNLYFGL